MIQILQIVLPYVQRRRNGAMSEGHAGRLEATLGRMEASLARIEIGQGKTIDSMSRMETSLAVMTDRDHRLTAGGAAR